MSTFASSLATPITVTADRLVGNYKAPVTAEADRIAATYKSSQLVSQTQAEFKKLLADTQAVTTSSLPDTASTDTGTAALTNIPATLLSQIQHSSTTSASNLNQRLQAGAAALQAAARVGLDDTSKKLSV